MLLLALAAACLVAAAGWFGTPRPAHPFAGFTAVLGLNLAGQAAACLWARRTATAVGPQRLAATCWGMLPLFMLAVPWLVAAGRLPPELMLWELVAVQLLIPAGLTHNAVQHQQQAVGGHSGP